MPEAGFLPLRGPFAAGLVPEGGLLPGAPEAALGPELVLRAPPAGLALGRDGTGLETGSLFKTGFFNPCFNNFFRKSFEFAAS